MKEKRKLSLRRLRSESQIGRARKLADASLPLIADLYLSHMEACRTNRDDGDAKRRRREKSTGQ
jgi:hypothetical protein